MREQESRGTVESVPAILPSTQEQNKLLDAILDIADKAAAACPRVDLAKQQLKASLYIYYVFNIFVYMWEFPNMRVPYFWVLIIISNYIFNKDPSFYRVLYIRAPYFRKRIHIQYIYIYHMFNILILTLSCRRLVYHCILSGL